MTLSRPLTFTAIVTAHAQDPSRILGNLLYQTRKADEIIVFHSDLEGVAKLKELFPTVLWAECSNMDDWGHDKRSAGLWTADSDVIGFFNADDSYSLDYIERMMAGIEDGADVVYCAWNRIPRCGFHTGSSTSGNFVVRTDLAREAGYRDRHYEADGTFIEALRGLADRVEKVDEVLYWHNEIR
jgi:hypothetical protein